MKTVIPEVAARPLVTAGRLQLLVDCPHCHAVHRHLEAGERRGPCGSRYAIVAPREDEQ
ncbi:hypothetical protein ACIRVK_13700 [Streptomyces sp. NPDC101152]|uniref:hypothetical protein n=1 Tax=Streptomyces sp. NPDC101152 TaxID=3366116 RepID=UPI0038013D41